MLVIICVLKTIVITLTIVVHVFLMLVANSRGHLFGDLCADVLGDMLDDLSAQLFDRSSCFFATLLLQPLLARIRRNVSLIPTVRLVWNRHC